MPYFVKPDHGQPDPHEGGANTEVYTPKDFELNRIMADLCRIVENSA